MRYSLTTLLLTTLLMASLMAVWFRREPWYQVREFYSRSVWIEREGQWRAPDGWRMLVPRHEQGGIYYVIRGKETIDPLFRFPFYLYAKPHAARFESNDEVHISSEWYNRQSEEPPHTIYVFHRRHPEWWWGHLYRPEVWASLLLLTLLVVRFIRVRRQQKLTIPNNPEVSSIPS